MTAPAKPKYRTTNWKDYNAALKARGSLLIWLDKEMRWHGSASGKRGRSQKYSEAAIQFCLTIKELFNLPCVRQWDVAKPARAGRAGLAGSRLQHRQPTPEAFGANDWVQPTMTGLHLLVDSTGIKMLGEGEWRTKKHGADYRRQWRKVHLGIDATTLEIRAIEVTGDAPMLPCLLGQIADDEAVPETPLGRIKAQIEQLKARVHPKVEHPFHIIKNIFGMKKVRYRRLFKNTTQLFTLFGLANLRIARRRLSQHNAQGAP
jgi:hypothetical protein